MSEPVHAGDNQTSHPVLDEIRRRVNGESPQLKLALSIEGGGMRSVVSAGMSQALLDNGVRAEYFDAVFGASGGAFNAAYYVAGQSADCAAGYWENTGKELIDFRRFGSRKKPAVDMDHMLYGMVHSKPLNFDTVLGAKKVRPLALDMATGEVVAFEPAATQKELLLQLRAGSAVPLIDRGHIEVDGRHYLDSCIAESIPLETPFTLGYDAVLVLATKPLAAAPPSRFVRAKHRQLKRAVSKFYPELALVILQDPQEKFQRAEKLRAMTDAPLDSPFAYVISPRRSDHS
ncbi:MAG TPA: patatin-like phospholipase family protein, partial [Candidatus Saccharimonadales bacterium]